MAELLCRELEIPNHNLNGSLALHDGFLGREDRKCCADAKAAYLLTCSWDYTARQWFNNSIKNVTILFHSDCWYSCEMWEDV